MGGGIGFTGWALLSKLMIIAIIAVTFTNALKD
jgi:hypothetical protein